MSIKVLMFDLDGTLLTSTGNIADSSIQAIKKCKENGIYIGICTGREASSVQNLLPEWKVDGCIDFIIGNGGGEILDLILNTHEALYPLEGDLIKDIIQHYQDMDVNFAIPYDGKLFSPYDDELIQLVSAFDKIPYQVIDFNQFLITPKPKVMIICKEDDMPLVVERAESFSNENYKSASLKTASVLYEYMDPRISKTEGIQKTLQLHQLDMNDCCCFGDADNDFDMIKNAAIGVAMGNASDKTKSVADYITEDNDHDGIMNFIEQYILN